MRSCCIFNNRMERKKKIINQKEKNDKSEKEKRKEKSELNRKIISLIVF